MTRTPLPRLRSACSPTTSWAAVSSPKPTSTCAASTGATAPGRRRPPTPSWPEPRSAPPESARLRLALRRRHELSGRGASRAPVDSFDQLARGNAERARKLDQGVDPGDAQPPLELADLRAVQRGADPQLLLRHVRAPAAAGEVLPEEGGDVHGRHCSRWRMHSPHRERGRTATVERPRNDRG